MRLRSLDIKEPLFFAQIDLHDLLQLMPPPKQMEQLPLYPGSDRDLTITLPQALPMNNVFSAIRSIPSKLLKEILLLDIYRSEELGKGM